MKSKSKLTVGIAGYGVVGQRRRHYIDGHPGLEVVAVCDKKYQADGTFDDGVRYYTNHEKLIEDNFDILFVCLTNDIAADVTIAGLKTGRHVFCEKPPGKNLDDIARVIQTEKDSPHLGLMYGFNHRYHDSVRQALGLINSGSLGKVINARGIYGKSKIISFQSNWRTKRDVAGGGILLDQGIHMVDLLRLFCGEFEQIHSFVDNNFWRYDVEDNAYALMKTKNGVVAFLHSTATQWRHTFSLDLSLEGGSISLSGILSGSKSYGAEKITVAFRSENDSGDPKEITTSYNEDNSWRDEVACFYDLVFHGKELLHGTSMDAYRTMELVYKIYCADEAWRSAYSLKAHPTEGFL